MTLPDERYRAIQQAGDFLLRLAAHPKKTPGVPRDIRNEAFSILRHYPGPYDLTRLAVKSPEVLEERMEPVSKLFAQYEQGKKDEA